MAAPTLANRRPWGRQVLALGLGALLAASAHAERPITDMAGRQITLPDRVERVYAVGHCIPIVGAVAPDKLANNYGWAAGKGPARRFVSPLFYEGKVVPATGNRLSDEEVLKMRPDVVVMETRPNAAEAAKRMEARLGVPVVLIDQDLLRIKDSLAFLGDVLERKEHAGKLVDYVVRHVDPIAERARAIPAAQRVRAYYAEGPDGLSTNGAGSSHTQVLDYVGGINVAEVENAAGEGMHKVTLEQIYLWRPDLILVWTPGAERQTTYHAIVDDPLWRRIDAVAAGRVVQIPWLPYSWFDRPPGSNRVIGTLWLAQRLYPEVFTHDMVALTREYSRLFLHHEIGEDDARYLLGLATPAALPAQEGR
ncbi:ABC transporter substrate-binding protein [Pseudothauera rhizosphaerae]|uniref:ABC transporter substrate-binding protein n=1 Tax=Pseudothauera rhizosphaerae TaxID=2565932 RepID=A0A4S4AAH5_9RHOO|nr:ABC transporter substrate-binding protein [Pseudothauera rhizosphaerae]THF55143.1 ABC transporter substrate-binding protein [Pseudothauera rhizosphaerae]